MRYNYCPKCGGNLLVKRIKGVNRPKCNDCNFIFYQNPIVGVAAIIIKDKKILLGERNSSYNGLWCIPCGYVEWDEDVYDAVKRETYEETGIIIKVIRVFNVLSNFHNPKQHTVGIWFLAEIEDGKEEAGDDLDTIRYFSYDTIPQLAFPTDRIILDQLYNEGIII